MSMVILSLSKRVHSLHALRLFNDTISTLLLNASLLIFLSSVRHKNHIASFIYSASVSVKMNTLLYAPAFLLIYLQSSSLVQTFVSLSICAGVQLVLGYPFLSTYPVSYLRKSFELDRVFLYKWTVNLKFLPENVFVSRSLSLLLLSGHIAFLVIVVRKLLAKAKEQVRNRRRMSMCMHACVCVLFRC